jgi:hypothetical protein
MISRINIFLTALLIMFSVFNINDLYANEEFQKYAKVKIEINNKYELEDILRLGIAVEHFNGKFDQGVELIVNYHELELIRDSGKNVKILIPDMREYYKNRAQADKAEIKKGTQIKTEDNVDGYSLGSMGGFHTYDEHIAIANYLHDTYPNIVSSLKCIGKSHEGVDIYAQCFSDNPDIQETGEGNVYFDGLIHAREPMAGEVLLYYMYWLAENYDTDPEAAYLINNRQIYLVTVLNPDGYIYNQTTDPNGGGMWRKNKRDNDSNGQFEESEDGVDLNRNYSYQWGYDNTGSSPDPSSNTYRGPSAFSEPESQAARDFILSVQPSIGFNCHTYSGVFINPYGYSGQPVDYEYYSEFAGDFAYYMNYPYGTSAEVIGYSSNGTARDWMHHDAQCLAWVPEIGETGFWPGSSEIIPLNSSFLNVLKYLSWVSGNYADFQNYTILEGEAIPGDTISFVINIKNKGLSLDAQNVKVELTSLNNLATAITASAMIDSIKSWEIKSNVNNPICFKVSPAAVVMNELKFRIDITQDSILTSSDTIKVFAGKQNIFFADDAENGGNQWTGSGSGQQWDTTFVGYYSNRHSFNDSRYGSYSFNTANCYTMNNAVNLLETENPRVEYATRWAIEQGYDYARIEISNDNGQSWAPLSGEYTTNVSGSPGYTGIGHGWVRESIDLTPYINQSIKFRFSLSSDGGLNSDGFYFDDFRIVDYKPGTTSNRNADNNFTPAQFRLNQNHPNPFNPSTTISYILPNRTNVELKIFNVLGQHIKTLVNEEQNRGQKKVIWNGLNDNNQNVSAGVYFIYLKAENKGEESIQFKKCILLK